MLNHKKRIFFPDIWSLLVIFGTKCEKMVIFNPKNAIFQGVQRAPYGHLNLTISMKSWQKVQLLTYQNFRRLSLLKKKVIWQKVAVFEFRTCSNSGPLSVYFRLLASYLGSDDKHFILCRIVGNFEVLIVPIGQQGRKLQIVMQLMSWELSFS